MHLEGLSEREWGGSKGKGENGESVCCNVSWLLVLFHSSLQSMFSWYSTERVL